MQAYDQHVHTYFSFDSQAQFEDYLAQTGRPFVTTEHLEFSNPDDDLRDNIPDVTAYAEKLAVLRDYYPQAILSGIEVGYNASRLPDIRAALAARDDDITLLSFHHDGQYDYQNTYFKTLEPAQHVRTYYDRMLAGLQTFTEADVLAHFDYGLRVLNVTPAQLAAWAGPQLQAIFALVVQRGMAFELNTKSMYRWGNETLYTLAIPLYLAAGGTRFTIGSDAHTADAFQNHFADAAALLRRYGVTELTVFRRHVAEQVDLPDSFI